MKTKGLSAVLVVCALCLSVPVPVSAGVNVTAKIKVLLQNSTFPAGSATTTNTYFLKNSSTATFTGPFRVVIESLNNRDVALVNPDGYTRDGKPYYEYSEASLGRYGKSAGKPWIFQYRCDEKKRVSATLKPFTSSWQIAFQGACSPLVTVYVSVYSSEGGTNETPFADAGPDQTAKAKRVIPLDGSLSTDEDGDPLTYKWTVVSKPAGSRATLTGATSVRPTVKFTMGGTYVLGLTVSDGLLTSARDTCTLSTSNSRPVAEAGPDKTVELGTVRLDGSASTDADGNRLSYAWSIVSMPPGSTAALSSASAVRPSFEADLAGEYVVQLVVSQGTKKSFPDFCRISTVDSRPRASAGADQKATVGASVRLDGAGSSDVDGDPLSYSWALVTRPAGSAAALSSAASVRPSFTADIAGTYVAQLTVSDGDCDSAPDTVIVTTENARPVADAGQDQTVAQGGPVALDGSSSSDADGDALTWKWALLSIPKGSVARLANTTIAQPSFTADLAGTYVVQFIVSDPTQSSHPDTVVIDTESSRPVANAGTDQTVYTNSPVQLDGSGSSDPEGGVLTPSWAMVARPPGSTAELQDSTTLAPNFIPDLPGTYVLQLIVDDGILSSAPDTVAVTAAVRMVSVPDVVGMNQSAAKVAIETALLAVGAVTTAYSETVTAGNVISQDPAAGASLAAGSPVALVVSLGKQVFTVPSVVGLSRTEAQSAIAGAGLAVGAVNQEFNETIAAGVVLRQDPQAGATVGSGAAVDLVLSLGSVVIPPDPGGVAPPLDQTVASALVRATEFIYAGENPIQKGVEPGTIEARRLAVIRGKVTTREGSPLPGVVIAILDHPEYGQTVTRDDGMFDMAVNGGGYLTLRYRKKDYLEAQRKIHTPWEDYVWAPDVALVPLDPVATVLDLTAPGAYQVAQGSASSDERGERRSTLLFPQGTGAQIVLPDGSAQAISTLTVRSTEYTVGENGPQAMPGLLPPGVEYTYAVELSVDEALAVGAESVRFTQPVIQYVENFLGFAVGARVPAFYYDREHGIWVPSQDGRVIGILSIAGGVANVDTNGDGLADDAARLATIGITYQERERLGTLYTAGQSLWRVTLNHFTPVDLNWPPPPAPPTPESPDVEAERSRDNDCPNRGSVIGCLNQTLGESVPIVGTPFTLNYRSDRVPGRKSSDTLEIPLSGDSVPTKVVSIELEILVAGRRFTQSFPRDPHQSYTFIWDGLDAYGRSVQGSAPVAVRVGYKYRVCYWQCVWNEAEGEWSCWENCPSPPVSYAYSWANWSGTVGALAQLDRGLGGWSLDINHAYDAQGRVLYEGTGDRRSAEHIGNVINTAAGGGGPTEWIYWNSYHEPDIRPAKNRGITPYGIATGPDGSIYVTDSSSGTFPQHRVIRVFPNGSSIVVAGKAKRCMFYGTEYVCYEYGSSGDGGLAIQAELRAPWGVDVCPDGSLYIADRGSHRVRRVDPEGFITTVAGTGTAGDGGDGGPATAANLNAPLDVVCAPDGTLYIATSNMTSARIRRLNPDGIITTVPGTEEDFWECGTPSCSTMSLWVPYRLAIGPDGSLYMAGGSSVRRVDPVGDISTVAGGCYYCDPAADGEPALGSKLQPMSVAVGQDGTLYLGDYDSMSVRAVRPDGTMVTVAGGGAYNQIGDGGNPLQAYVGNPFDVAVGPSGDLLIADASTYRVRKVSPPLPGFSLSEFALSSEDGREVSAFSGDGRHLRTMNALTGALRYEFTYDAAGRLAGVRDGDDNLTTIERDASGIPTAIVGPYGARTLLVVDSSGYLAGIKSPAGETTSFAYTTDGLMTAMTTPNGHSYHFTYDAQGGLSRDADPGGGFQALAKTELANGFEVARTTATGETTTYRVEAPPYEDRTITTASPCCGTAEVIEAVDGSLTSTMPDGMVSRTVFGPDPRFGMQSPLTKDASISTPAGLSAKIAVSRDVSLRNQGDPLSLSSLFERTTINGREYYSSFDASSGRRTDRSPTGRQAFTISDSLGRPTSLQIDGLDPTVLTYDSRGRLATMTAGSGEAARAFSFTYDPNGYLASVTDPLSRMIGYEHDEAGRLVAKTLPDGRVVSLTYDANGNLTSITPPGRPVHELDFNALDLIQQYQPPPLGAGTWATTYSYDLDRRLTAINRPDGESVSLAYSPEGRLQSIATTDGNYSFTYHPSSKYVQSIMAPGGGDLEFSYDGSLLLSEAWTGDVTGRIDQAYDNDFRVISRSVNGVEPVAFVYDDDGLMIQAGSLGIVRSAQNDLVTGTTLGSVADTRAHNSFGEPTGYDAAYNTIPLLSFAYVRDKLGRIVEKTETVGGSAAVYAYTYDTGGRLSTVTMNSLPFESYTYDTNGNRLSGITQAGTATGTYDEQDRLLGYGSATYAYSANGDLEAKTVGGQTTTYDYDALGNLRGVTLPGGTQIAYVMDGLNRRIGKKVNGALVQGFLYENPLHPVAELDGAGSVVARFVYGTRDNAPDYVIKGGTTYRIISDHLGSPRVVVNVATGDIAQEMTYDSFGNVLTDSAPGFQPFGFAGGLYDPHTKLTRFGARDYDAEAGRWTAKDPILFAGGAANLYGYVLDDPVNHLDVAGLAASASGPRPGARTGIWPLDFAIKITEVYVRAQDKLADELEAEIDRVRQMREEAERLRKQLERLLEELRRMFPCHKRGNG